MDGAGTPEKSSSTLPDLLPDLLGSEPLPGWLQDPSGYSADFDGTVIEGELTSNSADVSAAKQAVAAVAIALLSLYSPQELLADDKTPRQPVTL